MGKILVFLLILLVVSISIYSPNLIRVYKLTNLYNEKTIAHNFINMDKVFIASEPTAVNLESEDEGNGPP